MRGTGFRGSDTACALVLITFRPTLCPHIPCEWIITTVRRVSQKLTTNLPSSHSAQQKKTYRSFVAFGAPGLKF